MRLMTGRELEDMRFCGDISGETQIGWSREVYYITKDILALVTLEFALYVKPFLLCDNAHGILTSIFNFS